MARRSDHTKEELLSITLDAAKNIVIEDGYRNLTARKLAEKIGYTPGTLYNMYGSMDGVILEINSITLDRLAHEILHSRPPPSNDIEVSLKGMAHAYLNFARKNQALWLMVFDHKMADGSESPLWLKEKIESLFTPLEEILKNSDSDKVTNKQKLIARTLWASVHGICYVEQSNKMPLISDEGADKMIDCLIENFT